MARRSRSVMRRLMPWAALLPMALTVLVAYLGTTLWSLRVSVSSSRTFPADDFVGLEQYERLFENERWLQSLQNLAVYGVLFIVAAMLIGFLLAVFIDQKLQPAQIAPVHRLPDLARRGLVAHLVPADRLEPDRLQHMDAVDDPADGGLPVDGLQYPARGRGRHHVIGQSFDLQFRSGKQGVPSADVQSDTVGHENPQTVAGPPEG